MMQTIQVVDYKLREAKKKRVAMRNAASSLLLFARRPYIYRVEAEVQRYANDLLGAYASVAHSIDLAKNDSGHLAVVLTNLIADFETLARTHLANAANIGFERLLVDLRSRGWIKSFQLPAIAPQSVVKQVLQANTMYLQTSLLPDLHAMPAHNFSARIRMYASYAWVAAELAYKVGMAEYAQVAHKDTLREVGGPGSGNFGHTGRKGEVGGSAPSGGGVATVCNFNGGGDHVVYTDKNNNNTIVVHQTVAPPGMGDIIKSEVELNQQKIPGSPHLTYLGTGIVSANNVSGTPAKFSSSWLGMTIVPDPSNTTFSGRGSSVIINSDRLLADVVNVGDPEARTYAALMATDKTSYEQMIVDHEMGHAYYNSQSYGVQKSWAKLYDDVSYAAMTENHYHGLDGMSKYGRTSANEMFAESYTAYVNGRYNVLPVVIREFFDKNVGTKYKLRETVRVVESNTIAEKRIIAIIDDFHKLQSTVIYNDGTVEVSSADDHKLHEEHTVCKKEKQQ